MPQTNVTTYGPGGYDPDATDGNVVEERTVEVPEDPEEAFRAAVDAATTLAELKAAILGESSGPGAAARPS